jgi:hypothetical protein
MTGKSLSVRCECHRLAMPDVSVICAHASSPRKLEKQLQHLLAGRAAEDVLSVSHWSAIVSTQQYGGIWTVARQIHKLEYSAVVLVRAE